MKKQKGETVSTRAGVLSNVPTQLRSVFGDVQIENDRVLLANYGYEVARREQAILVAQDELDEANDDFDVAWAWQRIEETMLNHARFEARVRLARRRETLRARTLEAQRKKRDAEQPTPEEA